MRILPLLLLSLVIFACSKKEDVNSLRIIGSNTHYNHFSPSEDGNFLLLDKKQFRVLNAQNPSSLLLKDYGFDSLEIERVVGNADTLLLQTKNAVVAFNAQTNARFKNEIPGLSVCSIIAKTTGYLLVANGVAGCAGSPALSLYSLADLSKISLLNTVTINAPLDLKTYKNTVFVVEGSGSLKVFTISAGVLALKQEYASANAREIGLFPQLNKVLVKTNTGMSQYEILNTSELKLVSTINQAP